MKLKLFTLKSKVTQFQLLYQSEDGEEGKLLINHKDTLSFNFGHTINNLAEVDPLIITYAYEEDSMRNMLDSSLIDLSKVVITKKSNFDIDEVRKQNVKYLNISGYTAKITYPRSVLKGGITGVYVDSLMTNRGGRLKFNLFASNLDSASSENLITTFKSIQFHLK